MDKREPFLEGVINYLKLPTSGALMISGAWGSGKTYYIEHTLYDKLKEDYCPIKISLFGLEKVDNIERLITEEFLSEYGEDKLTTASSSDKKFLEGIVVKLKNLPINKVGKATDSITEYIPWFKQFVDTGRIMDSYYTVSARRLPKEKLVIILDDLERAVKTIKPHLLLGAINNLVETKEYKVIVVANDSYFNDGAKDYLEFKEKVIERTLLFPPDIVSVYKELVHGLVKDYGSEFELIMLKPEFIDVINPQSELNKNEVELKENLKNIRIIKFALVHYANVFSAYAETIKLQTQDKELFNYLLSLWALTVGLSIEYKRNRLTYQERDAYIIASAVDSFVVDLDDNEPNPFEIKTKQSEEEQKKIEQSVDKIRDIFKVYIERRTLPLVPSVQLFDVVMAGVSLNKERMIEKWREYKANSERQQENPAAVLLNSFILSIGSFSNEEFPVKLKQLADYTTMALFPDEVSYINAATFLQHYGSVIGFSEKEVKEIITKGIDKHFSNMVKPSPIAKSNLQVISSEIPSSSKWVLDYSLMKLDEITDRNQKESIDEAVRQFKEDMMSLARRLMPNPTTMSTPDFISFPILAKIPEDVVVEKIKSITPSEVEALCSIIRNRFVEHNTTFDSEEEIVFLKNVRKGIEARGEGGNTLSDYLINDHLVVPLLNKFSNAQRDDLR